MTPWLILVCVVVLAAPLFAADDAQSALPDFDKLWNYSNPAATQQEFEKLLEPAAASGDDAYYYSLQTQIARCMGLQGEYAKAHKALDRVETFLSRKDIPLVRVRYLLERGRVYNSSGSTQSARALFAEAYGKAVAAGLWLFAVDAAHMVAFAENNPTGAVEWNLQALKLTDDHPETARWKVSLWNNLGEAYRAKREYEKSLACFQSIIQWQQDHGKPVDRYTRVDEAKLLRLCGRTEQSMKNIRALHDELGNEVDGFVCEELAENLLLANDEPAAKREFVKAWKKLKDEPWLKDAEPQRYERLREIAS